MSDRRPIVTWADVESLDQEAMHSGFRAGFEGWPIFEENSRSYWHGWRCGRLAAKIEEPDADMVALLTDLHLHVLASAPAQGNA